MYFYGILNYQAMILQQSIYSQWFDTQHAYQSIPLPQIQEKEKLESVQAVKVQNIDHEFQNEKGQAGRGETIEANKVLKVQERQRQKVLKKDENFSVRIQKEGRNVCSNTLKYFIKFVRGHSNHQERIKKIIQIYKIDTNPKQFLDSLKIYVVHAKHYIRPSLIHDILVGKGCTKQFSLIFRQESPIFFHKCRKLQRKSKQDQMSSVRNLQNTFFLRNLEI